MKKGKLGKFLISLWIVCFIVLFPYIVEYILLHGPSISSFENDVWFSFIGSYSGGIITVVVLFATIRYNNRSNKLEYERGKIKDIYTKEKVDLDNIIDLLVLNKISFSDENLGMQNLKDFFHELQTVTIMIKYANRDSEERESFYSFLSSNCILYGVSIEALIAQYTRDRDIGYVATELRKMAASIREDIYVRKKEYLSYLENEEKERLKQLFI